MLLPMSLPPLFLSSTLWSQDKSMFSIMALNHHISLTLRTQEQIHQKRVPIFQEFKKLLQSWLVASRTRVALATIISFSMYAYSSSMVKVAKIVPQSTSVSWPQNLIVTL